MLQHPCSSHRRIRVSVPWPGWCPHPTLLPLPASHPMYLWGYFIEKHCPTISAVGSASALTALKPSGRAAPDFKWSEKKPKTKPESAGHCALPRGWTHDTPGQLNQDLEAANPFLGVESFSAGWELPATRLGAWWSFLKQLCLTAQSLLQLPCKTRSEPQPWNNQFQRAHPRARAEATESSPLGCSRGHQEV